MPFDQHEHRSLRGPPKMNEAREALQIPTKTQALVQKLRGRTTPKDTRKRFLTDHSVAAHTTRIFEKLHQYTWEEGTVDRRHQHLQRFWGKEAFSSEKYTA